ncbi:MAG: hypothetical protein K2H34_04985, partial [Lachnospiraceae bacterium]|nr:hypothetical protein [Lachnospiraceae bacterium]
EHSIKTIILIIFHNHHKGDFDILPFTDEYLRFTLCTAKTPQQAAGVLRYMLLFYHHKLTLLPYRINGL